MRTPPYVTRDEEEGGRDGVHHVVVKKYIYHRLQNSDGIYYVKIAVF